MSWDEVEKVMLNQNVNWKKISEYKYWQSYELKGIGVTISFIDLDKNNKAISHISIKEAENSL